MILKKIFSFFIVFAFLYCVIFNHSACKKKEETAIVVTVYYTGGGVINGAKVRIHCDTALNKGCIIDRTQFTNKFGQTSFNFDQPAVLFVVATKDTLSGKGYADIIENKIVELKVYLQ